MLTVSQLSLPAFLAVVTLVIKFFYVTFQNSPLFSDAVCKLLSHGFTGKVPHTLSTQFPRVFFNIRDNLQETKRKDQYLIMAFFLSIDFIGATLVYYKIIHISGAKFHNTPSVNCIMCSLAQVRHHFSPRALPQPLPPAITVVCVHEFFLFCSILPPIPTAVSLLSTSLSLF